MTTPNHKNCPYCRAEYGQANQFVCGTERIYGWEKTKCLAQSDLCREREKNRQQEEDKMYWHDKWMASRDEALSLIETLEKTQAELTKSKNALLKMADNASTHADRANKYMVENARLRSIAERAIEEVGWHNASKEQELRAELEAIK